VTNECGQVSSDPAVVTFATSRVLAWPTDQAVNVDQPVFFVVEVDEQNNCGPLSFQWERRDPLVLDELDPSAWIAIQNGGGVVGATSPALGILRPTPGLASGYRCRITGDCGCEFRQTSQIFTPPVNFSAACPSDFNLDGSVDGDDVIYFFERWDSGC
jgi:hypothetical protein